MCHDNNDQPILIKVYLYGINGNHKIVREVNFNIGLLLDSGNKCDFAGKNKKDLIQICDFQIKPTVSFLDYIMGGCSINVHVAIDFTMSNKSPTDPTSLHYVNPQTNTNQYSEAILSVLSILENSDRLFPTYGFGGKVPGSPDGRISHCFALNGDIYNPECNGVKGVMKAYFDSLKKVKLWGGTHFSSVLDFVNGCAKQQSVETNQVNQSYTICLILTDGIINDREKTINEIIKGSNLPISIIIVGIGEADFQQMEDFDADVTPLYSERLGQYSSRDIVQFVPLRDLKNDPILLAKSVLAEVPKQLTTFFQSRNIQPNPKKMHDKQDIIVQGKMKNQMQMMMKVSENFFVLKEMEMQRKSKLNLW